MEAFLVLGEGVATNPGILESSSWPPILKGWKLLWIVNLLTIIF